MRIILFDGVCRFCDASVQFIIKRDRGQFHFASLQSDVGQQLRAQYHLQDVDSVVLIENGNAYTQSAAALHITKQLSGLWKLFYLAIVVPRPLRDAVYALVARNRYRLFGKKDVCSIPTAADRSRFID